MSGPLSILRVIGPDPSIVDRLRNCLVAHFPVPPGTLDGRRVLVDGLDGDIDGTTQPDGGDESATSDNSLKDSPDGPIPLSPNSVDRGFEPAAGGGDGSLAGSRDGLKPPASVSDDEVPSRLTMHVANRYFTAAVHIPGLLEPVAASDEMMTMHKEDGVLLVVPGGTTEGAITLGGGDGGAETLSARSASLDAWSTLHSAAEASEMAGDLLRLCVAVTRPTDHPAQSTTTVVADADAVEAEYSRRVLWCLDRGYEYVEVDLSLEGIRRGHDDRDKDGFARVVEAISTTVWSSAQMNSERRSRLKSSYEQAKGVPAAVGEQSGGPPTSQGPTNEDDETADENLYQPPSDLHDREALARQALLLGVDEAEAERAGENAPEAMVPPTEPSSASPSPKDLSPGEDREQERYFDQFEGALREAGKIREMSRSGDLSDEDRRRRAGDAAMLLMDLMSKMGGGLGESGSDTDDPPND